MKLTKTIFTMFAAALMLGSVSTATAHDDKYFDSIKSAHDGQTRMAGALHLELLLVKDSKTAKDNAVKVYVTDHAGTALSTKGASASLTIVQGANKSTVTLTPEGDNMLVGKASYASTVNLKAALTVTMAGKGAEQARFTPFAPVKKAAEPAASH